jgi:hypothetical protein
MILRAGRMVLPAGRVLPPGGRRVLFWSGESPPSVWRPLRGPRELKDEETEARLVG